MPPEKIGRYEIVAELGRGAMGVVYKATDPNIGRLVALKTMRLDVHGIEHAEMSRRFRNEGRAAGTLNHPNIVTIYDAHEVDGLFYIAMEYIEGETLQAVMLERKALATEKVIGYTKQICAGLDYAHGKGIIHRDIKPANIMITPHETVKIMDFGIAKSGAGLTSDGRVLGTPSYMSPEQVRGRPIDGRSDLFGLGVMLYEMVTGEKPFTGESITTIIYKIVNEQPIAPRDLDATVH
ncbi:MAG TPA: serine/threonine-protein kinase, partial [Terriglobales bacterium]